MGTTTTRDDDRDRKTDRDRDDMDEINYWTYYVWLSVRLAKPHSNDVRFKFSERLLLLN